MVLLLTLAFFSILFFFGWELARSILRERRVEHLAALSGSFGIGLYVFFLNAVGFFMPIQAAFYAVLLSFLLLALGLHIFNRRESVEWVLDEKWRNTLLLFTLFLVVSVGFISFRHPMDLFTLREPTAVTMAEGNFPPREIWSPDNLLGYHYAPDLLSAALYKTTGMPIYAAYALQKAVLTGTLFLLAFVLILSFFPSAFVAFWSSLLMLYAGSLVFLKGLSGIPALFETYVLGREAEAPFAFINEAIGAESGLPAINYVVQIHWGAMAFALMLAVAYLYFRLHKGDTGGRWPAILAAGLLLALLALVAESYFVILAAVLFAFPFIVFFFERDTAAVRKCALASFFILLVAAPAALLQGGVLRSAVAQQLQIAPESAEEVMLYTNKGSGGTPLQLGTPLTSYDGTPIYSTGFLAKWLLLLAVLVPAFAYLFRQRLELAIFFASAVALFFSFPFLFESDFQHINDNLERFFYPVNLFGGLVAGVFLASLYLRTRTALYAKALIALTAILMAQGVWTHGVWLTLGYPPGGPLNPNAAFFAKAGTAEAGAYEWVKGHTSGSDRFLIIRDEYSECGFSGAPNCLFIFNTGRMAPIFRWHQAIRIEDERAAHKIDLFDEVKKDCSSSAVRELGFSYLYVDEQWPAGMEAKCLENNEPNLVFENGHGGTFIRMYSIHNKSLER